MSMAKAPTALPGRVCGARDCVTTLSRYNAGTLCWCHTDARLGIVPLPTITGPGSGPG